MAEDSPEIKKLDRSTIEFYIGLAIAIVTVVFPMTWWLRCLLLMVLAGITVHVSYRHPSIVNRNAALRTILGMLLVTLIVALAWKPIREEYKEETRKVEPPRIVVPSPTPTATPSTAVGLLVVPAKPKTRSRPHPSPTPSAMPIAQAVPIAPLLARLQFSFFTLDPNEFPLKEVALPLSQDGTVTIEFTAKNITDVLAKNGEIALRICEHCIFAKEPEGFKRLPGSPGYDRNFVFAHIFQDVSLQTMSAEILPPAGVKQFEIALRYFCETCGKTEYEKLIVKITRPQSPK